MKLNKKQEEEAILAYKAYFDSYIGGDVKTIDSMLVEEYNQIGSAESEVFFNKQEALKFLYDTIDQVAGKTEIRNRIIKIDPLENFVIVTDLFDIYVLIDKEWTFYSKFRASTLMQEIAGRWKFVHQHSSVPDLKAQEGENIAIEKISKENLELREAIKRRTIELEHKNRELEIEASLERIRARTMAMQNSEELKEAALLLFQQIKALGVDTFASGFNIWDNDKKAATAWMAGEDRIQPPFKTTTAEDVYLPIYEAEQRGESLYVIEQSGKELEAHYEYLSTIPVVKEMTKAGLSFPTNQIIHCAFFSKGYLMFISYKPVPEAYDIFKRFAKVFEQTYTRFLDLQKAEAQAREAQIEAALERVRARSMAMHTSDEFVDASDVMVNQLKELGIHTLRIGIGIINKEDNSVEIWSKSEIKGKAKNTILGVVSKGVHPIFDNLVIAWKEKKPFFSSERVGDEVKEYYEKLDSCLSYPKRTEFNERETMTAFFFNHGSLNVISLEPLKEEDCNIMIRFAKVFGQIFQRFLDLQIAEAQAREAQIEAALERVRSRTMAMHKSEQLSETAMVMFDQFYQLGQVPDRIGIGVYNKQLKRFEFRMTDQSGSQLLNTYNATIQEQTTINKIYKAWKNKEKYTVIKLTGQNLKNWISFVKDDQKLYIDEKNIHGRRIHHAAFFSQGFLLYTSNIKMEPEFINLLTRFANVFDQTYTRFLDLKKAESQAREAQIETALEKVRGRAMAMHKSDELLDVGALLYQELVKLGIANLTSGYVLMDEDEKIGWNYLSDPVDGKIIPKPMGVPHKETKVMRAITKSWKKQDPYLVIQMDETGTIAHQTFIADHTINFHLTPEELIELTPERLALQTFNFKEGYLLIVGAERLREEQIEMMLRFTKVFEMTYRRFLDLQKAEAQAREAQIEVALERVRARAMAMHHSDELNELMGIVFTELTKLDLVLTRSIIMMYEEKSQGARWWMANSEAPMKPMNFFIQHHDNSPHLAYIKAWKNKEEYWQFELGGTDKVKWDEFLFKETELSHLPKSVIEGMMKPEKIIITASFNKFGCLSVASLDPLSDEHSSILIRFAKVFEQTYTRFLDLQKAEAQAREAQIETALERVRSRTMAMQKSEEIADILGKIFEELNSLDVVLRRILIWIFNNDEKYVNWWMANPEEKSNAESYKVDYIDHPVFLTYLETWKKKIPFLQYTLSGDSKDSWEDYLFNNTELSKLPKSVQKGMREEGTIYLTSAIGDYGLLMAGSLESLSAENTDIIQRFERVFQQSYTRYLDVQKAEAQAKEAVKQSSLDRVRAEIASMRSAEDLQRITPIIWAELITLGVPFFRCGVFIINEDEEIIHAYLSTPEGESLGALHISFDSSDTNRKVVEHWRYQKVFSDHWDKKQFKAWTQSMVDQGQIKGEKQFQAGEVPPDSLSLHFIPFTQGMLYVGSSEPLSEDQLDLVKTLTEAFSVAYARYEDFKKLEDAKGHVENTLKDLKAAQSQLIQSEKMASLGELTAGIAHEIQNPLNFVNNFSEVSEELISELKEELEKGEVEEAKLISNDVIQNLQKINQHGQRASSIVKGMLEHSRSGDGVKEPTDINALADEYLRLAYHGLRAKNKSFNANFKTEFDKNLPKLNVVPQDIGRVLLNLINNAFYAVSKASETKDGDYKPEVTVSTKQIEGNIEISVKDNGIGIPEQVRDKIFQPFFTTKPSGSGTGLGLSLSYDIVKAHGGKIKLEAKENKGTEFTIVLGINTN